MHPIIEKILTVIVNPVITVLFVLAIVVFLWGLLKFVATDEGAEARENGKRSMFWGIVGFFIMVSVWGIIAFIRNTLGL